MQQRKTVKGSCYNRARYTAGRLREWTAYRRGAGGIGQGERNAESNWEDKTKWVQGVANKCGRWRTGRSPCC